MVRSAAMRQADWRQRAGLFLSALVCRAARRVRVRKRASAAAAPAGPPVGLAPSAPRVARTPRRRATTTTNRVNNNRDGRDGRDDHDDDEDDEADSESPSKGPRKSATGEEVRTRETFGAGAFTQCAARSAPALAELERQQLQDGRRRRVQVQVQEFALAPLPCASFGPRIAQGFYGHSFGSFRWLVAFDSLAARFARSPGSHLSAGRALPGRRLPRAAHLPVRLLIAQRARRVSANMPRRAACPSAGRRRVPRAGGAPC